MTDRSPNEELALLGGQICVNNAANTIEMYSDVVVGNSTVGINAFLSKNSYFRSAEVILASNNQNNVQFIDTTALYPNGSVTPKFLQVSFNTGQIGIYQPDANLYQEGAQIVLGYKGHYPNNQSTTTTNNWNIDVFGTYGTPRNLGGEPVNAEVQFPDSLRFFHYDGTAQAHLGFGIVPANNGPWTTTSTRIYMGKDVDPAIDYVNINFLNPINLLGNIGPSKDCSVWVGTPNAPFDGVTVNNGILWVSNVNQGVGVLKIQTDGNFVLDSCYENNGIRTILHTWSYANNSANSDYEGGPKGAQGNGLFIDSPLVIKNGIIPYGKSTRGNAGQVLTSTGAAFPGVEWKDVPGGPGSVNTDAQYIWTNLHTHEAELILDKDIGLKFKTDGTANTVFVQQGDNNFVMYSGQGTKVASAVWSVDAGDPNASFRVIKNLELYNGLAAGYKGSTGTPGQILSSTGTGVQWINNGVNTAAVYNWTNSHTFTYGSNNSANVYIGNSFYQIYNFSTNSTTNVVGQTVLINTGEISVFQPNNNIGFEGASIILGYKGQQPTYNIAAPPTAVGYWNIDIFGAVNSVSGDKYPDSIRFINYPAPIANDPKRKYSDISEIGEFDHVTRVPFGALPDFRHVPFQILASNTKYGEGFNKVVMGRDWTPTEKEADQNALFPVNVVGDIGPVKVVDSSLGSQTAPFKAAFVKEAINYIDPVNGNNVIAYQNIQTDYNQVIASCYANGGFRPMFSYFSYANSSANADYQSGEKGKSGTGLFLYAPLVPMNGIVPYGSNSRGNPGDVLTSDGSGVYWGKAGSGGVNTDAQYVWSNQHTFNANVIINGNAFIKGQIVDKNTSAGSSGQILSSTGTGVQWINQSVNTSAQYTWTNNHTFNANVTHALDKNIIFKTPSGGDVSLISQNDGIFALYTPNGAVFAVPTANTGSFRMLRDIEINNGIVAGFNGSKGTSGQVLSSTGTGVLWTNNVPKFYTQLGVPDTNVVANSMFLGAFVRTNSPSSFSIPSQFTTIDGAYFYIYNASPSAKDLQVTTSAVFEVSPGQRYLTSMNVVPIGIVKVIVQDAGTKFVVLQEGGTSLREMMNEPPVGSSDLQARIIELENRLLDLESKTINKTKRQ